MNYALDALWWKLTDPAVRDLAALLTAPPLWHSGAELPVRELLGEHGFRYLLQLDQAPQILHQHLSAHAPFAHRLGLYAEQLLAFWFANAPHTRLLAHNLPVRTADALTLGAADFIATVNGKPYHIELACKYYGSPSGRTDDFCGLNRQDCLRDKAAKLPQQMMLLKFSDGLHTLKTHSLPENPQPASVIRGIAFLPADTPAAEAPLNPLAWQGRYLSDWAQYPAHDYPAARYALLERMAYLAPARLPESRTFTASELSHIRSGLVAVLEQRPDGHWHEILRLMKTEPDA
ncbi:DUF1853 family protein [Bergeriella denitrificans]|uniref:Domain of uncharacterized function (DUF1853) n=1 Tax=Bergeriella denitrificans TaxID=494 RepID=A0A378UGQ8_BERDE|nr:DUF1853 family protein [Bergeriella denitrificans]STZ76568.1 Domain of uncharacterised function (DUF1853) [Bergeriella denitrificans]